MNFRNKKLSQIEEEEEGISNIDDPRKSQITRRELEMRTGLYNNSKYVSGLASSLDKSKKRSSKPVLKAGNRTAYESSNEKFVSQINESDLKHMNTMNINGKNFHLFESIKNEQGENNPINEIINNKERTAEENVLEHIKEESSQQNTLRNTITSNRSRNNFSFRNNNNFRFDPYPKANTNAFLTSKERTKNHLLPRESDRRIKEAQGKMNTNPDFVKKFKINDMDSLKKFNLESLVSVKDKISLANKSISVTNNEIIKNNNNLSINNKVSNYIIIVNDQKQQKALEIKLSIDSNLKKKISEIQEEEIKETGKKNSIFYVKQFKNYRN